LLSHVLVRHWPDWGNVKIFTKCVRKLGYDYNVPIEMFYPVHCGRNKSKEFNMAGAFFDNLILPANCVSYHYWSNRIHEMNITHEWMKSTKYKNSLIKRLSDLTFKNYSMENKNDY